MYKGYTFLLLPQVLVWLSMALGLTWDMEFVTTLPRNVMFGVK